jgi:hypothetical protein
MMLWLVRAIGENEGPFRLYDTSQGFVIRAGTEAQARAIAAQYAGDEGRGVWFDANATSCEPLETEGEVGVVLQDWKAG